MALDPVTTIAAALAKFARFIPPSFFGLLLAGVAVATFGDRFTNPDAVGLAVFAGGEAALEVREVGSGGQESQLNAPAAPPRPRRKSCAQNRLGDKELRIDRSAQE